MVDPNIEIVGTSKDKVLVADDSPDIVNFMKKLLQNHGYEVTTVASGAACLEALQKTKFQLLLLDFMMPGLNGIDILKKIRTDQTLDDLVVIMVTALQSKVLLRSAIKNGVNDFILKPISVEVFNQRVEKFLVKIQHSDISKMLLSLNIMDSSTLDQKIRKNLQKHKLNSYPFKIGTTKCCAILDVGKNPHALVQHTPQQLENEIVIIGKSGFLWNLIWPRQTQEKFAITRKIFNENEDLAELVDSKGTRK